MPGSEQTADDGLLVCFPPRQNPGIKRQVFFDAMPNAATCAELESRGYEPTHVLSLSRDDELGHRNFLLALSQGMAEGTIFPSKPRLQAAELDMRAHGMLNKYGPANMGMSKRRKTVEEHLEGWQKGHHALGQSTVMDPADVERMLRAKAGVFALTPKTEKGRIRKKWKRQARGVSND